MALSNERQFFDFRHIDRGPHCGVQGSCFECSGAVPWVISREARGQTANFPQQLVSWRVLENSSSGPMVLWARRSVAPAIPCVASLRFFFPNSLPVGGFSRVSDEPVVVFAGHRPRKPDVCRFVRKAMKDPPTPAVEDTSPLQKTHDMLCSGAAVDFGMASPTKCIQTHEPKIHAVPKNGAVGGRFATV